MYSKTRRSRERGIALISVLWVLLLLSGLAGAAAYMARADAILTHNLGEFAQAESAADAAIVNAIAMLSDEKASHHPSVDGQRQTADFQGTSVATTISNEAGRIDVNTADDDLILAFLYSQRVPENRAAVMLGNLRKYQQVTQGPAPQGTLRSVDELKNISGWDTQDLDCWRPALTVYTGLPSVNSSDAPEQVGAALKWAKDNHMGNREWVGTSGNSDASTDRSLLGEVIRIVASASPNSNINANVEWVGRLTGDTHQPALTMKWSRTTSASNLACKNTVK